MVTSWPRVVFRFPPDLVAPMMYLLIREREQVPPIESSFFIRFCNFCFRLPPWVFLVLRYDLLEFFFFCTRAWSNRGGIAINGRSRTRRASCITTKTNEMAKSEHDESEMIASIIGGRGSRAWFTHLTTDVLACHVDYCHSLEQIYTSECVRVLEDIELVGP